MPFDSAPPTAPYKGTAKLIDDALSLLGPNGEHWIKQTAELNGKFCVLGALWKKHPCTACFWDAIRAVNVALDLPALVAPAAVVAWNDASERSFADVREVLTRAREWAHANEK